MEAWRLHYTQLRELTELEGVDTFMVDIFSNLLRDSKWGMVLRVSLGAFLSMLDGATDIYTISTYYKSEKLTWQANAMFAMVSVNMVFQVLIVRAVYKKHPWQTKLKEILICLTFLRPAVDAYRVSTNHEDNMAMGNPFQEMIMNKGTEVSERMNENERTKSFVVRTNLPNIFVARRREHPRLCFAVLRLVEQPRTSGKIRSFVDRHLRTNHGLHVSDDFFRSRR